MFVGLEWEEFTRFVKTRWLCLEKCSDKAPRKYPALRLLFQSGTGESSKEDRGYEADGVGAGNSLAFRFARLNKDFNNPLTEFSISFYTSALTIFTHFNLFLQRSDPLAHSI